MGANTKIEWTHHTANTWWGCTKVSDGCKNCYAEAWSNRWGENIWGKNASRRMIKSVWGDVRKWAVAAAAAGERRRVFWGSMMDVCEDRPDLVEPRKRMCGLIEELEDLDFLLLTKRPENYPTLMPWKQWPKNAWAGTSVEDQPAAVRRIPLLSLVPASIRFLSCEPLLGPIDLRTGVYTVGNRMLGTSLGPIHWAIFGGESGARARSMDLRWLLFAVGQCRSAGVAPFVKQLGARPYVSPERDGGTGYELKLKDAKGGDMSEWPKGEFADIHVREFPKGVAA